MASTVIRGAQILNNTVQRQDLDTTTVGQALVTKIVQGSGITLSSTGADSGTGDVTVTSPDVVSTDTGNIATLGTDSHILVPQSQIWSVRLRSYNALQNSAFEVDQRNVGGSVTVSTTAFVAGIDRWSVQKTASATLAAAAVQASAAPSPPISLPGTNFAITSKWLRVTLNTQQASLAAGDLLWIPQQIEGPRIRGLFNDSTSISILARSNVTPVSFGISLRDGSPSTTKSLVKLATINSAGWNLLTFPNIPVFPAGNFVTTPGTVSLFFSIGLAVGSTYMTPANDTWQSGNFLGAVGQTNFASLATGTFIDFAFAQLEPGPVCTTLIDCPFQQAYDEALRYYTKSYQYGVVPGTATALGGLQFYEPGSQAGVAAIQFKKTMAKAPTVTMYSISSGAINTVRDFTATADKTVTGQNWIGDSGLVGPTVTSPNASPWIMGLHYTADTGW